jgi:hypothetical protein
MSVEVLVEDFSPCWVEDWRIFRHMERRGSVPRRRYLYHAHILYPVEACILYLIVYLSIYLPYPRKILGKPNFLTEGSTWNHQ